jgi:hypothetical protein
MKAPIFVYEPRDLCVFASVEEAEQHLEPIDVRHDRFIAYDSEGRLLSLSVMTNPTRLGIFDILLSRKSVIEYVAINEAESKPTHEDQLRNILVAYLSLFGESTDWLKDASLDKLVERSFERYGMH